MTAYFGHATSFCREVWRPVLAGLEGSDLVTWNFAGHGGAPELEVPIKWSKFADQVLDETEPGGIGVGHSMAGVAMVLAQLTDPTRFRFLVLIEPVLFPGPKGRIEHRLAEIALKRRRSFESREAVAETLRDKPAFADWSEEAFQGYLDGGFVGDGPVELACRPEYEAEIYNSSQDHDAWDRLAEIEVPVLILAGADSDTTPPEVARLQAAQFQRAGVEIVTGAGHFLPMTHPELVAERVGRLMEMAS